MSRVFVFGLLAALLPIFTAASANADLAFVNEIHYDNAGADTGEFVEFAIEAGADLTQVVVELVNGSNGTVYDTLSGSSLTAGTTGVNFGGTLFDLFVWTPSSIQNGAPDGVAITTSMGLQEFLSYEGVISPGRALGTSTDFGVSEVSSTPIGSSIQLDATGTFVLTSANTQGLPNFESTVIPEPSSFALLGLFGIAGLVRRRR